MAINVRDYGAGGAGQTDDTAAIQQAVDFAKTVATSGGGSYRPTVYFPAGYYYITAPINITNTVGIWLSGDGSKWLGTCIFGATSGALFDFSGSSQAGCENFYFLSTASSGGTNRATIGVQFALTANGGLNCGVRNCSFQMEDFAVANNGFGSIGILNVRAEEFYVHECFIRANTPVIMSNKVSLVDTGVNFTVTSRFQTLSQGQGSMGVTSMIGCSLQSYEKRQPAIVLNGTNSFHFQGYLGRGSSAAGTNETAILCSQYTTNLRVHGTIEFYSRILKVLETRIENTKLDIVIANSSTPTTELIDVTRCFVRGLEANISIPNAFERPNRYVLFHADEGGGYQQAGGDIRNSQIACYEVATNQYIVTANLLKKAVNCVFNTDKPFEKKGGKLRQLTNVVVPAGTRASITPATIFQFRESNQLPFNNTNGGYYRIWIDGVIRAGNYNSGFTATMNFQAQIVVNQLYNGVFDVPAVTVVTLGKSVSLPSYLDISGVNIALTFSNGVGTVTATPRVSGSGSAETVNYDGFCEIQSDFRANDPVPLI